MAKAKPQVEETTEPQVRQSRAKPDRVDLHMSISHALEVRLTFQAKLQKVPRNVFAERLLDQALSRYATDRIVRSTVDGSAVETDAAA